ncbi:hypothetical protein BJ912DRAFT_921537 [Pholiota molesta]|nr:hypothetical protein BJ912DRAFT_921537 [Pholiota molesta]
MPRTHNLSFSLLPSDDFLDDTEHGEHGIDHHSVLATQRQRVREMYDINFDSLLERLHERAVQNHKRSFDKTYPEKTEDILRYPGIEDYALWRVACRVGSEEYILASLLNSAQPEHELRSVTTRQSLRGSVYLECRMNERLIQLLKTVPGILQTRNGIRYKDISHNDKLSSSEDGTEHRLGAYIFEYGLLVKQFNFASIGTLVNHDERTSLDMPFTSSAPLRMDFTENEQIAIIATKKNGFIIRSYVCITSGPHREKEGWVTKTEEQTASVYVDSPQNKINDDTYKTTAQIVDIHINSAYLTNPPFHFAAEPPILPILRERQVRHPWCGNPRKGQSGEIIDVLMNQSQPGGVSLLVQLQQFDPVSPFPVIRTEVDCVVHTKTRKHLMDYFNKSLDIPPRHHYSPPAITDNDGNRTPVATASTTTPAWDPSSRTPLDFLLSRAPPRSHETTNFSQPTEVRNFQVVVDGGEYSNKVLTAKVVMIDGIMLLRYPNRGTDYPLQPEWVSPLHPSPTHDNGLVVVIRGEHHGKYLRRLHHDGYKNLALMIAAVVERRKDATDDFTGEVVKIDCESLCVVKETAEEVKRMKTIMLQKRTAYRKGQTQHDLNAMNVVNSYFILSTLAVALVWGRELESVRNYRGTVDIPRSSRTGKRLPLSGSAGVGCMALLHTRLKHGKWIGRQNCHGRLAWASVPVSSVGLALAWIARCHETDTKVNISRHTMTYIVEMALSIAGEWASRESNISSLRVGPGRHTIFCGGLAVEYVYVGLYTQTPIFPWAQNDRLRPQIPGLRPRRHTIFCGGLAVEYAYVGPYTRTPIFPWAQNDRLRPQIPGLRPRRHTIFCGGLAVEYAYVGPYTRTPIFPWAQNDRLRPQIPGLRPRRHTIFCGGLAVEYAYVGPYAQTPISP